ncbi:unnamed protein product, partial [Closterium sp. NIES-53]
GPAASGVSQVDPLPGPSPVQVAVGSGATRGAASGGAESGSAEPGGAESDGAGSGGAEPRGEEPGGAESVGVEPEGAELEGAESGVAKPRATGAGGARVTAGAGGAGGNAATGLGGACTRGTGAAGTGGVEGAGAGDPTEPRAAGAEGTGAGGAGAGGAGAAGAGAVVPGAGGARDTVRPRPYFVPLLQQILGPTSPLPAPSPYNEHSGGLTELHEPASLPALPARTARRVPRSHPPSVPGTHVMALRPSSIPLRIPLPAPPESSLPESAAASALVAELLDFAAACGLDYATALVAESASASPPSVGGECALGTDVLEERHEDFECLAADVPCFASMLLALEGDPDAPDIPTPRSYAEAITGPYSSQWQVAMDAEMS